MPLVERDVAVQLDGVAVGVDEVALARRPRRVQVERVAAHRAADDAPGGVDEQVVQPGGIGGEHDAALAVAHVAHVAARHHDAAVGVEGDAAHATALGHRDVDRAVRRPAVHPTVVHVGVVEVVGIVDARAFDQAVAPRQRLEIGHGLSLTDLSGVTAMRRVAPTSSPVRRACDMRLVTQAGGGRRDGRSTTEN